MDGSVLDDIGDSVCDAVDDVGDNYHVERVNDGVVDDVSGVAWMVVHLMTWVIVWMVA